MENSVSHVYFTPLTGIYVPRFFCLVHDYQLQSSPLQLLDAQPISTLAQPQAPAVPGQA